MKGTDLTGATAVAFGANPATGATCSETPCTATAQPGAAGSAGVRVAPRRHQFTCTAPAADVAVCAAVQHRLALRPAERVHDSPGRW